MVYLLVYCIYTHTYIHAYISMLNAMVYRYCQQCGAYCISVHSFREAQGVRGGGEGNRTMLYIQVYMYVCSVCMCLLNDRGGRSVRKCSKTLQRYLE